ncbi:MAG TPA: hypothetical protein VIJ18_16875 [Microbacteriaceae bacterium]
MVRQQFLLVTVGSVVGLVAAVVAGPSIAIAAGGGCTVAEQIVGQCDPPQAHGSIDGGGVNIGATQEVPGSAPRSGDDAAASDSSSGDSNGTTGSSSFPDAGFVNIAPLWNVITCQAPDPCANPTVRLSDLINFRAPVPTTSMEPNGWAVVGLDANFVAGAAVDVQSGTLLRLPAQVRFTPAGFSWDYGDGAKRTSADGGASWAKRGIPEFSPTPTSHAYLRTGSFTVQIGVSYTAEYRFANQNWQQIPGILNMQAPQFAVVVGDAKTVLVGRDCVANPRGPGC